MSELKYYEEVEAYCSEKMSPGESLAFETKLASDPELKAEYEAYQNTKKALKIIQASYLKNKLALQGQKKKANIISLPQLSRWAAAAILLIGLGLAWFANTQFSNQAIVAKYYQVPNLSGTKSEGDNRALADASDYFLRGDFVNAIQFAELVHPGEPHFARAQYILGHVYLKTGDLPSAEAAFRSVTGLNRGADYDEAKWYLTLILIKENKENEAIKLLDEIIAADESGYKGAAGDLKDQLNAWWRSLVF